MWESMLTPGISIIEKMLRPLVVYVFLLVGLRLAGKRELAQLNPMDFIVLLTLSNTVQNAIIGPDDSVLGGLIGAATLLAVNYFTVRFLFAHPKIDRLVEGRPTCLIEHGKVHHSVMGRELLTKAEVLSAAHKQGIKKLDDVERAVLEPSGFISFTSKEPTPSEVQFQGVNRRLDTIAQQLGELRALVAAR